MERNVTHQIISQCLLSSSSTSCNAVCIASAIQAKECEMGLVCVCSHSQVVVVHPPPQWRVGELWKTTHTPSGRARGKPKQGIVCKRPRYIVLSVLFRGISYRSYRWIRPPGERGRGRILTSLSCLTTKFLLPLTDGTKREEGKKAVVVGRPRREG